MVDSYFTYKSTTDTTTRQLSSSVRAQILKPISKVFHAQAVRSKPKVAYTIDAAPVASNVLNLLFIKFILRSDELYYFYWWFFSERIKVFIIKATHPMTLTV